MGAKQFQCSRPYFTLVYCSSSYVRYALCVLRVHSNSSAQEYWGQCHLLADLLLAVKLLDGNKNVRESLLQNCISDIALLHLRLITLASNGVGKTTGCQVGFSYAEINVSARRIRMYEPNDIHSWGRRSLSLNCVIYIWSLSIDTHMLVIKFLGNVEGPNFSYIAGFWELSKRTAT